MSVFDTTAEMALVDGLLHLRFKNNECLLLLIRSPDDLLEYDIPVGRGEDHEEPGTDEDNPGQLHVTEHHFVHHDVVG